MFFKKIVLYKITYFPLLFASTIKCLLTLKQLQKIKNSRGEDSQVSPSPVQTSDVHVHVHVGANT